MSELKQCPFCGHKQHHEDTPYREGMWKVCDNDQCRCEARNWNTRPIEDELRSRVEELEGLLRIQAAEDFIADMSGVGLENEKDAELTRLREQVRWRKIPIELPEPDKFVLARGSYGSDVVARKMYGSVVYVWVDKRGHEYDDECRYTRWLPIPGGGVMDAKMYLRLGNDYPYDVLDMVNFTPSNDPAIRAARGVVFDLCDRRDIKRGFENVDEDVRHEIIISLAEIIREAYTELTRLREQVRWIPVGERLPEIGQVAEVIINSMWSGMVRTRWYIDENTRVLVLDKCTHWRLYTPDPVPPKEEE